MQDTDSDLVASFLWLPPTLFTFLENRAPSYCLVLHSNVPPQRNRSQDTGRWGVTPLSKRLGKGYANLLTKSCEHEL